MLYCSEAFLSRYFIKSMVLESIAVYAKLKNPKTDGIACPYLAGI